MVRCWRRRLLGNNARECFTSEATASIHQLIDVCDLSLRETCDLAEICLISPFEAFFCTACSLLGRQWGQLSGEPEDFPVQKLFRLQLTFTCGVRGPKQSEFSVLDLVHDTPQFTVFHGDTAKNSVGRSTRIVAAFVDEKEVRHFDTSARIPIAGRYTSPISSFQTSGWAAM